MKESKLSATLHIALEYCNGFSTGTKRPFFPLIKGLAQPGRQSVEITGIPIATASNREFGIPSKSEDKKKEDLAMSFHTQSLKSFLDTDLESPNSQIKEFNLPLE